MAKIKIMLNRNEIKDLLRSSVVESALTKQANLIAGAIDGETEIDYKRYKLRGRARVIKEVKSEDDVNDMLRAVRFND